MRLRHVAQGNGWEVDSWSRQLQESDKLPPAWINEVLVSDIANMETARMGVFVRLLSCQFLRDVRTFIMFGMPVWFVWDSTQQNTPHDWADLIRPTTQELTNTSVRDSGSLMDTSGDWGEVNAAVEDASSNKPKLRTRNEAAQSNKKRLENETPERRIQRERREKAAEEKQVPGKRGARVYEWLESETSAGVLVRMAVSRASVEDTWDNYRVSQKCYDGFHDEWDLCDGFDPAPRNYGPPTDEFDKDDDNWDVPAVTGQAFINGLDALGPNDLVEDLLQQGGPPGNDGTHKGLQFDAPERMAKLRLGFNSDGYGGRPAANLPPDIINSNGSLARLRNRFHDLHPTSLALAPSLWNQNFVINVLKQRVETEDPANRTRMIVVDTFIYVLRPKVRGVPWLVAVLDPVAALEWLRLGRC
ncbi:hypothetical protein EW145_g6410 [Phellinidium pouzarii]|uniref:Uncharacterized protein n=1 Tax=Phellinidium pouzarii TaxID=167371 RepID=A0A4S4KWR6_9AGAM|nr:hypothetical protein EW145_g6410 [Phellinidium pouzarii]